MPEAKDIKVGEWIIFNREPYKLKRKEIVTAGTHMHSMLKFIMTGLFSTGEKSTGYSHHDRLYIPDLEFKTGQVIALFEKKCQIMDVRSYEVIDAEILEGQVKEGDNVSFVTYNGKNIIVGEARERQQQQF